MLDERDSVEHFETRKALFVFKGDGGKDESLGRANVLNDVFDRIHHVFGPRKSMQRASPGRTSNSHTWFLRCSNHNCVSILLVFFTDRIVQHDHLLASSAIMRCYEKLLNEEFTPRYLSCLRVLDSRLTLFFWENT